MSSCVLPALRSFSRCFLNFFSVHNLIGIMRRAAIIGLMLVMVGNHALAAPQGVAALASDLGYEAWFRWHSSEWAARFARQEKASTVGWDGRGAPEQEIPEPEPQETQAERLARVVRVE